MNKKIALCGMLTALAIVAGYIEMLIPIDFAVPGIKLGLANVVVLYMLAKKMTKEAIIINATRILIIGFMFGNLNSIIFSLSGGIISFAIMLLCFRCSSLHMCVISVFGAISHVIGQLIVGLLWYPFKVLAYYSMFLIIAAIVTGFLLGIITSKVYSIDMYLK